MEKTTNAATQITVETTVLQSKRSGKIGQTPVILYVGIMLPLIGVPLKQKMICARAAPSVRQWRPKMEV